MPAYRMHPDRKDVEALRSLRRRLHAAALALGLTIVISTLGLLVLGRHGEQAFGTRLLLAFWDTLNLVSTIGNLQEEFTLGQRLWAIVVILFGLGAALFGFSTLQALIQEDFVRLYARRKMKKTLEGLDGHVIVCGYGQVGRAVVDDLLSGDVPHVVIDNDEDIVDAAEASDVLAIHGDCTRDETLDTAGVHRASGLVATLNSDAANVFLILVARELNPSLRIVARAEREESCARIRRAGANQVIVPSDIAGFRLSGMIRKPNISEFMDEVVYNEKGNAVTLVKKQSEPNAPS